MRPFWGLVWAKLWVLQHHPLPPNVLNQSSLVKSSGLPNSYVSLLKHLGTWLLGSPRRVALQPRPIHPHTPKPSPLCTCSCCSYSLEGLFLLSAHQCPSQNPLFQEAFLHFIPAAHTDPASLGSLPPTCTVAHLFVSSSSQGSGVKQP